MGRSFVEAHFSSVERINAYIREVPLERQVDAPALLPSIWPTDGAISIQKLSIRYREGLPLVLNDISLEIKPKEKVGIGGFCWVFRGPPAAVLNSGAQWDVRGAAKAASV
jgi:ABC-type multidrug transport system fused ATPase/permease subunit